jgi:hypothetical protein
MPIIMTGDIPFFGAPAASGAGASSGADIGSTFNSYGELMQSFRPTSPAKEFLTYLINFQRLCQKKGLGIADFRGICGFFKMKRGKCGEYRG